MATIFVQILTVHNLHSVAPLGMQTLTTIWGEKQKKQTKEVSPQPMLEQDQTRMEEIDFELDELEQAEEAPLVASSSNTYDDCVSELRTLLHPKQQKKEGSTAHCAI